MNRRCVIFAGLPVAPELCVKILARKTSSLRRTPAGKTARALGFFFLRWRWGLRTAPARKGRTCCAFRQKG